MTSYIRDLVSFLGLKTNSRKEGNSVNYQCPFCGDKKYHLNVNMEKGVYKCVRCGTAGGTNDLYARVVKGAPASSFDSKELFKEIKETLYGDAKNTHQLPYHSNAAERMDIPCAPDHVLDGAFRSLLSFPPFKLSNFHEKKLLSRGLTKEDIVRNGYRSIPGTYEWVKKSRLYPSLLNDRKLLDLAKEKKELSQLSSLQLFGCIVVGEYVARNCDIKGVPGFFKLGKYHCFNGMKTSGILIPTRNENGEIVSMQLRTDNYHIRYMTISSKHLGGPNSGISRIHYPADNDAITFDTKIFLTEGPLKADTALSLAKRLAPGKKIAFAAVQGINNTQQEKSFFKLMQVSVPGKAIYLAFDMDKLSNPFVLNGSRTAMNIAKKYDVPLQNYCWDLHSATKKCAEYYRFGQLHGIGGLYPARGKADDYHLLSANTKTLFQAHLMEFDKSMWVWNEETKGIDDYLLSILGGR